MVRIALISDITPVPLTAGPMVLFRHFVRMRQHPTLVISGVIPEADPADRHWQVVRLPRRLRWLHRPSMRPLFEELRSRQIVRTVRPMVRAFRPDVILTVWASEYLLPAARIAAEEQVPLVLICHDDFEEMLPARRHVRRWARRTLGAVYRGASARLCVSEALRDTFQQRYGVGGTIMYPMPGDPDLLETGPAATGDAGRPVRVGFSGNAGGGTARVLAAFADALGEIGGELYLTGTTGGSGGDALRAHPAIVDRGFLPSVSQMRDYFRHNVDAMLIAQSFEAADAGLVAANLPSKLTEAVHVGLPLVIVGPPYASAVRWAAQHPSVSLVCPTLARSRVEETLRALGEPERRGALARASRDMGIQLFHPDRIHQVLEGTLADLSRGRGAA